MGVKLDVQKASAFYSLAAGQDDPVSTINLACFFAEKGVRQDKYVSQSSAKASRSGCS